MIETKSKEQTAVLLVGGMGTRLRSVLPSKPKPLATIGDTPFLVLLVQRLRAQGIRRIVMCSGYMADAIEDEFGDGRELNVSIAYSREPFPLGTAGALKYARNCLSRADDFFVLNGDSFVEVDLQQLLAVHRQKQGIATIAVQHVSNAERYGTIRLDPSNRATAFEEKSGLAGPGLINAGVYAFTNDIFRYIPEGHASLERDVFPKLLKIGVYGVQQRGLFIDIGTPEDYALANQVKNRLFQATSRFGPQRIKS